MNDSENVALIPDLVAVGAATIADQAGRLGLTWSFSLATVVQVNPLTIVVDGDTAEIDALSLVGTLLTAYRVGVFRLPEGINLVMGYVGPEHHGAVYGENGAESISFTTQLSATVAVTFATPFQVAPNVHTNINSGVAATSQWQSRAFGITTTGFTIFVYGPSATWSGVQVQWSAFART